MKVIIVGCGRLGGELATQMSRDGHSVTVVDKDPGAFFRLGPNFGGRTVAGVGFDRQVLIDAGIERADALAAVTSGDNTNIITARVARNVFRVPKVVARLYDPQRAEIYQRLGLSTVSPTTWGVGRVMQLLANRELNVIMTLGNSDIELIEFEIPVTWVSRAVSNVSAPGEMTVTSITRRGRSLIPTQGTVFEKGDQVVMTILSSSRNRLASLLTVG